MIASLQSKACLTAHLQIVILAIVVVAAGTMTVGSRQAPADVSAVQRFAPSYGYDQVAARAHSDTSTLRRVASSRILPDRTTSVAPAPSTAFGVAAKGASGLGDLTTAEVRSIQTAVNGAGRPLDVVGSAARAERRGVGTDLPIGKGPGTRSDIDYLMPHGSVPYYESTGIYKDLPDIDHIIGGIYNPFVGPSVRFEPFADPFFIPGAP